MVQDQRQQTSVQSLIIQKNVLLCHYLFCISKINLYLIFVKTGPPREILQGGTRLLWGTRDRLRLLSNGIPGYNVNMNDDLQPEFGSLK
jgi:hypothetical protein